MFFRVAGREFRPSWLPTLATLLILPILIGLGLWQWQRAEQKQALQLAYQARLQEAVVELHTLNPSDKELYRAVSASGRYDSAHQILLDNQIYGGKVGYFIYTPLRLNEQAILINRGWLAMGANRTELPAQLDTDLPAGTVTIMGRLGRPANPGILLENPSTGTWPKVVQHIDYQELSQNLGYPLKNAVILLDPAAPDGFLRAWQPTFGGFGPERHIGYAVQWFALAATLLMIYLVSNFKKTDPKKTDPMQS